MKLLVVEDDESLAALLQKTLAKRHYQLDLATDGQVGWELAEAFQYDLILLDWMLPRLDGFSFCRQLRGKSDLTPVLLMTANEAQANKIRGLDSGADDYVVKPFDLDELLARIRALLRRGKDATPPLLTWGCICLDSQACEVLCDGQPLHLTAKEYSLLELFLRHPQRIFNADALLDSLWNFEDAPSENAVRAHIKALRRKLRQAGVKDMLETVYGLGYRLRVAPSFASEPAAHLTATSERASGASECLEVSGISRASRVSKELATPILSIEVGQTALQEVWGAARQQYLDKLDKLEKLLGTISVVKPAAVPYCSESAENRQYADKHYDEYADAKIDDQAGDRTDDRTGDWADGDRVNQQMRHLLHSLKGGLGTFGLNEASAIAAQAQALLGSEDTAAVASLLYCKISDIRQQLEAAIQPSIALVAPSRSPTQHCWLVTQDEMLWQQLAREAKQQRIQLQRSPHLPHLDNIRQPHSHLAAHSPEKHEPHCLGVIVDLDAALDRASIRSGFVDESNHSGLQQLGSHPSRFREPVLLALVACTDLLAQVQAARLGCKRCLPRTTAPSQIFSVMTELMRRAQPPAAKILLVDHEHATREQVRQILAPRGFHLTLVDDPRDFLLMLEQNQPDLVILNDDMPEFNGLELCRVLRGLPDWQRIPVVFLSAYSDSTTLRAVFAAGADDCVRKPIDEPELIQRILNRLERARLLEQLIHQGAECKGRC